MRQYGNSIKFANSADIMLSTGVGTRIGTSILEKLGFFGVSPIGQPVATSDIKQSLVNLGLIAGGSATPLNLQGGTLNASNVILDGGLTLAGLNITQSSGSLNIAVSTGTLNLNAPVEVRQNYLSVYATNTRRHELMTFRVDTADATATELTIDGLSSTTSNRWTLLYNNTYACTFTVFAKRVSDGVCCMFKRMFIVKNVSGTSSIQGNVQPIGVDINPNGYSVNIAVDNTNSYLKVTVTGEASTTVYWMATLESERIF